MSANCNKNSEPRNGTNRLNRFPKALDSNFVAIDERDRSALYRFADRLGAYINYYYYDGIEKKDNWQSVFNSAGIKNNGNTEPHLALFDAFLELYAIAQKDLNQFTEKHLNYFFETVLGFQKIPATPDRVYLKIELAKHISDYVLTAGAAFKAGKNAAKKDQFYKLLNDFSFSHAEITSVKSVLINQNNKSQVYASPIANSEDGFGEDIKNEDKSWKPFGSVVRPLAPLGFALSSPLFRLAEGKRKITITIDFVLSAAVIPQLSAENFVCLTSSEKGWEAVNVVSAGFILSNKLELVLFADETKLQIVDYNKALHLEDYRSPFPVIKILIQPDSNIYNSLTFAAIKQITIATDVKEVRNLLVQNSLGKLDPSKPMELFGAMPTVGSNFYIGSSEIFQHRLKSLKLNFEFLNLPGIAFNKYYKAYAQPSLISQIAEVVLGLNTDKVSAAADAVSQAKKAVKNKTISIEETKNTLVQKEEIISNKTPRYWETEEFRTLVKNYVNNNSFKAEVFILDNRSWVPLPPPTQKVDLFGTSNTAAPAATFQSALNIPTSYANNYQTSTGEGYDLNSSRGYLKLRFSDGDFGYSDYQLAHTRAILNHVNDDQSTLELPNAPYKPLIQNLYLDYSCEEIIDFSSGIANQAFKDVPHKFFVVHAFGPAELHPDLNAQPIFLLPKLENEGELYFGLANAVVPQHLSFLIKVSEGTADPDFEKARVRWSYLKNNVWVALEDAEILRDQTNGLLTSGIVTLAIPKSATTDNTILSSGLIWIRASVEKNYAAICDIISLTTQVAEAVFANYDDVLPEQTSIAAATISKTSEPNPAVKKIIQPFASFGGSAAESGKEFHLRTSERLRHKKRAISQWDYERLILAQFPEVFTAKCINNCNYTGTVGNYNSLAPGKVTIITVPSVSVHHSSNPLKPKLPKNTIEEIKAFINKNNSSFAEISVQNPIYEEVKIHFHVKLKTGYAENVYLPLLNARLRELISPWLSNQLVQLAFGGKIEKSSIIYHLEQLNFVDYITCFKMYLLRPSGMPDISNTDLEFAEAATAASVLTSYPNHTIINIDDLQSGNEACGCKDCDDNVIKTNKQTDTINECGCN
ncbi:baseplate J/gp47 family protein [Pedobacter sandarakinus]|uniref:baseplate J/gp47 family protein n=1 Tax=Pedobacter sandarakinus TaxID=353156 RepID=UPI0022485ABD|nr:baseplate J/gp47 family protein [Pedobacter sandarakinus]MCX2574537.1 baseplate J/gp47 family protein [Pedobacter sandarakinus]